jgi:hypothetical protein
MGWEPRGKKRYFYRSVRVNGQPRKVYLGGGAAGEAHARLDARERRQRAHDRASMGAERARLCLADAALDGLKAAAALLTRAMLLTAGYHDHRGLWRMRAMKTSRKATKAATATQAPEQETAPKPPEPSASTDGAATAETAAELTARLKALVARADAGDGRALAGLRRFLDDHPEVWEHIGDLAARAERAWIEVIAGDDHLAVESYQRQVARMKADLNGPHATRTESLLVEQVVSCWLAMKYDEMAAALQGGSAEQAGLRLRRAESTQRRYASALKLLVLLRAKLPQGLAPVNTLALYEDKRRRA